VKKIKKCIVGITILLGMASVSLAKSQPTATKSSKHAHKAASFTPAQVKELHGIIKGYLLENPEVLAETAQALKKKTTLARMKDSEAAIKKNKKQLFSDPDTPWAGAKKPAVYLVEFFDYQCGHCKRLQQPIDAALKANPSLRVIFKEFPIFGKNSEGAAKVALAANEQGKYLAVHEGLMKAGNPMTEKRALTIAKKAGCNMKRLKKAMGAKSIGKQLAANTKLARELRLEGTPALVFANAKQRDTVLIPGGMPLEAMQTFIDKEKTSKK
jgi:protein-disulfide isomerase